MKPRHIPLICVAALFLWHVVVFIALFFLLLFVLDGVARI